MLVVGSAPLLFLSEFCIILHLSAPLLGRPSQLGQLFGVPLVDLFFWNAKIFGNRPDECSIACVTDMGVV